MPEKAHHVLYVPKRGRKPALCALYVEFTRAGRLKQITPDVPAVEAPWIKIQKKEYTRLCHVFGLRRTVGRPVLSDNERMTRKRESSARYSQKIVRLREHLGLPLAPIVLGQKAPDSDVLRVMEFLKSINPETQKPYTGVEIAILVRRSASFVSRVRNGHRRTVTAGT